MAREIIILVDYKGNFSSKYDAVPYRSGMDKELLFSAFEKYDISIRFLPFSEVDFYANWEKKIVLYTSSEDDKVLYKSYIEDIIQGLELAGAIVVPKFQYLRAHHNKVFMEILRSVLALDDGIKTHFYGTVEELIKDINDFNFPCVIKSSAGALSRGVAKANNKKELINIAKKLAQSINFYTDVKDYLRCYRHKGYLKSSIYRNKFIVQTMIPNLENDWKVLVFGNKIFNLKRYVRKNDFRASGSHVNYQIGSNSGLTREMMEFVYSIYKKMNVPMLSFDLAYDGQQFYMIEFQILYFGTSTFNLSNDYYERSSDGGWILKNKDCSLEELYSYAIHSYLVNNGCL
jgi:glutathione synthase/RimK-type ligase-like ATP-grasp enzyme